MGVQNMYMMSKLFKETEASNEKMLRAVAGFPQNHKVCENKGTQVALRLRH